MGYCRDSRWEAKVQEKQRTYRNLVAALREAGWQKVHLHVVPLGATGVVRAELKDTWKTLGVEGDSAKKLNNKLATCAWNGVRDITKARFKALQEVRQQKGDRAGAGPSTSGQWNRG